MNRARETIADFIVDIRFSQRKIDAGLDVDGETAYMDKCKEEVQKVFACRHNFETDRYGWPICLK